MMRRTGGRKSTPAIRVTPDGKWEVLSANGAVLDRVTVLEGFEGAALLEGEMNKTEAMSARGATVSSMEIDAAVAGRALVVVVDDRTAHGGVDSLGPLVTELLTEAGFLVDASVSVQADEVEIRNALNTAVIGGVDLVISVGGTGMSPRDVTPEATEEVLDRVLPGISEALRASGLASGSLDAGLSRGLAGVSGSTLVVNLPGSRAAIRDGMATLGPLASRVIDELSGLAE